ncbi:MAG TPA: hypothetical protein VHM00_10460 [Caldimonas sp.]|jgi:hypothetical protein|nr:hypothetical protein [Caldimonas sp.]HEX2541491.1 hypothetical protein [Caldimonas sp.]
MDTVKVFRHLEYELHCGAKALDGGRFKPTLTVAKDRWPKRPREIDVPLGEHRSEHDAIEAAYSRGVSWINEYGTLPAGGK